MLQVIYTKDIAGNAVVPWVDDTRDITLQLIRGLQSEDVLAVEPWMMGLLMPDAPERTPKKRSLDSDAADLIAVETINARIVPLDESFDWAYASESENLVVIFLSSEIDTQFISSFVEFIVPDLDEVSTTCRSSNIDLHRFVFARSDLDNGVAIMQWLPVSEDVELIVEDDVSNDTSEITIPIEVV